MKKIVVLSLITSMLLTLMPIIGSAAGDTEIGKNFAVYLDGPDKSAQKSTLDMTGSPIIYGNAIVKSGTYLLTKTWDEHNITNGLLYPGSGVKLSSALTGWALDQILAQGIIAPEANYTAQLPQLTNKDFPTPASKGALDVVNNDVTISESGWYTDIKVDGDPNTLTFDVSGGKKLHIRADKLSVNGNVKIVGDGKVYLYVDNFVPGGTVYINTTKVNKNKCKFGDSKQLFLYLSDKTDVPAFNSTVRFAGSIFAPNSNLSLGGDVQVKGNIYAGGSLTFDNSAIVNGLIDVPNANVFMGGAARLDGALIAKTLEMVGSAVINKADIADYDFLIDEDTPEPTESPEPTVEPTHSPEPTITPDPDLMHPGILGEYYDTCEFTNESALKIKRIDENIAFNFMLGSPDNVIEPDTFAIRWTGYIKPEVTSDYTFKTYSDDGVKLTVDGKKLIDRWGLVDMEYTISSDTVHLEAGKYYPVTMEYQEIPINSTVFLFWEGADVPMALVPDTVFFVKDAVYQEYKNGKYVNSVEKAGDGLKNTFYTIDENGNKINEYTENSNVDYRWGWNAPGNITDDVFYGTMDGQIEARYTEATTLGFYVDDGIKVWIDDKLVIDGWSAHSEDTLSCVFNTEAGHKYKIHIEFVDLGLSATCVMYWRSSLQDEIVPKKLLYSN